MLVVNLNHLIANSQSAVRFLLLSQDGSPDGVEAVADEPQAVSELSRHGKESVGHVGPQNILT